MMRFARRFLRFWLGLLVGLFIPFATAGAAESAFQATTSFAEQLWPSLDPSCAAFGHVVGTGVAVTLRHASISTDSWDCVIPLSATSFAFYSSNVVLTTPDGVLFATYQGTLSNGIITGTYTITGGTEQYVNVTGGSGTLLGFEIIDLASGSGTGQVRLKGTLSR